MFLLHVNALRFILKEFYVQVAQQMPAMEYLTL